MALLKKENLLRGLKLLDKKARQAGIVLDISIYGGAALLLAYDLDRSTRDVDVVIRGGIPLARKLAAQVAEENNWPENWLNDGVKGFVSANEIMLPVAEFNAEKEGGIRLYTPSPEYLFAMKCMAMRSAADGAHDIADIHFLAGVADINDAESALKIIESFYPARQIPARVSFGVHEIMAQRQAAHDGTK